MKVCVSTLATCLLALLLVPGTLLASDSPKATICPEDKQTLLTQVETLEQQLREREINIDQFHDAFAEIDGLPEGPLTDRVLAADDTAALRSALDDFKDELQEPWPLWMNILAVCALIVIAVLVILLLCTRDGWFILAVIFLAEGGSGSDF